MSVFQFCLHGLSPGDCTMATAGRQPPIFNKNKKILFFCKIKTVF